MVEATEAFSESEVKERSRRRIGAAGGKWPRSGEGGNPNTLEAKRLLDGSWNIYKLLYPPPE
jgi:hypothetical protein